MDSAQSIAVFCPMRYEPNIIAFIEFLWRENKRVSAPRIRKEDDTLELRLFSSSNEQLEKHRLGGLQPTMNAELVSKVDIIIVPALAIDERGFRIGYGRGYYDKLLASETSAMAVGIIFDFQRVLELPNEAHDMPVSWIVTDACELNVAENQQMRHK
jgi:5-formyltetrahydrofolate cyclo-ligase